MEKVLTIACSQAQMDEIRKTAAEMKIRVQEVSQRQMNQTLEEILKGTSGEGKTAQEETGELEGTSADGTNSLLIFNELTEKHFDRFLAKLREVKAGITYKAVVTPTNRTWNLQKLYVNMEMEKRQFEEMRNRKNP